MCILERKRSTRCTMKRFEFIQGFGRPRQLVPLAMALVIMMMVLEHMQNEVFVHITYKGSVVISVDLI